MTMMSRGPKVPQVIQLLDWYEAPDRYILVLEHPKSAVSLDQFVSSCGNKISEAKARVVMHQVITAANACCERGVYNNIKLESLLINPHTLQVKLMDFGTGSRMKDTGYTTFWGMYDNGHNLCEVILLIWIFSEKANCIGTKSFSFFQAQGLVFPRSSIRREGSTPSLQSCTL